MRLDEILTPSDSPAIANPHSAYCAFIHGVVPKWNYVMQTTESVGSLFQPLEDVANTSIFDSCSNWLGPLLCVRKRSAIFTMSTWMS